MTNSFDGKATPEAVEVTTSNLGPYEDLAVDSGLDTAKDKPTASAAPDPQLRVDGYEIDSPAQAYPPHTEEEIAVLMDSIRADGQIETAILHEGKLLHGLRRGAACERLGIPLLTKPLPEGVNVLDYLAAAHPHRNLTPAQRAAIDVNLMPFYAAEAAKRKRTLSGTRANADGSQPEVPEIAPEPHDCGEPREKAAKSPGSNPHVQHSRARKDTGHSFVQPPIHPCLYR